jgi:hypothetical protein
MCINHGPVTGVYENQFDSSSSLVLKGNHTGWGYVLFKKRTKNSSSARLPNMVFYA